MTEAELSKPLRPWKIKDISGLKSGKLTALELGGVNKGKAYWKCHCECGETSIVMASALSSGHTQTCGCSWSNADQNVTHGYTRKSYPYRQEYMIWIGMKRRCFSKNAVEYPFYGGVGITMCKEWSDNFELFLNHIGPRPSKLHSVDRFPNMGGNYEPGNVRWAIQKEQVRNRRVSLMVEWKGVTKTLMEWSEELGIKYGSLFVRLKTGWPVDLMLTAPIRRGIRLKSLLGKEEA